MTTNEKALLMHEKWNGKLETVSKTPVKTMILLFSVLNDEQRALVERIFQTSLYFFSSLCDGLVTIGRHVPSLQCVSIFNCLPNYVRQAPVLKRSRFLKNFYKF